MDPVLEDLLRSMWGGITPYLMPLVLLAVVCILRVRVAEILADIYYVFTRRYQRLGGTGLSGACGTEQHGRPLPSQERLERFWDALCNWREAYRDAVGLTAESLGKVHIANGLLVLNIEKALPFLPPELRATADEIIRDCIRERQIWQTAAEKREAFLKDAATAYAKIDRQIQQEIFPRLEERLRPVGVAAPKE
jgi:hypothetical protein